MVKRRKWIIQILVISAVVFNVIPCFAQTNPVDNDSASIEITGEGIVLTNTIPVYAMQFEIVGKKLDSCVITATDILHGFEIGIDKTEERIKVLIYNLNQVTVPGRDW